jgi:hypothetical protein
MKRLESWLSEYEITAKDIYRELVEDKETLSPTEVSLEIDELYYARYKLGDKAADIDKKYLPAIYEVISSQYPEFKEYFLKSMEAAGVDLSLFQKATV